MMHRAIYATALVCALPAFAYAATFEDVLPASACVPDESDYADYELTTDGRLAASAMMGLHCPLPNHFPDEYNTDLSVDVSVDDDNASSNVTCWLYVKDEDGTTTRSSGSDSSSGTGYDTLSIGPLDVDPGERAYLYCFFYGGDIALLQVTATHDDP